MENTSILCQRDDVHLEHERMPSTASLDFCSSCKLQDKFNVLGIHCVQDLPRILYERSCKNTLFDRVMKFFTSQNCSEYKQLKRKMRMHQINFEQLRKQLREQFAVLRMICINDNVTSNYKCLHCNSYNKIMIITETS